MTAANSDDDSNVRITLRDIYAEVVASRQEQAATTAELRALAVQLPDHETRLRSLERDHVRRADFDEFRASREAMRSDYEDRLRTVESFKAATTGARGLMYTLGMIGGSSAIVYLLQHLSGTAARHL